MADSSQLHEKANPQQHTSFILRCWPGATGQVRARLIDVRSKQAYPVARLADLPALIERLLSSFDSVPHQQQQACPVPKGGLAKFIKGGDEASGF